jgi:predicted nuclease of predicted toxin-antitoxin system
MKLKLDENLPESLVATLGCIGHDADNVRSEGLTGQSDADIWQAAQKAERFLITQDLDFSDIRKYSPGTHHGLMLVRLRVPGRHALASRIEAVLRSEKPETWTGCFVLLTDNKLRVHRPPPTSR